MKKVEVIIRPAKLEEVKEALGRFGFHGMTVSQVLGAGLQKGRTGLYRGNKYDINLLPKIKLELVIQDNLVDDVIQLITQTARTGEVGDGKIFIYTVDNAVRVRTGESGDEAI